MVPKKLASLVRRCAPALSRAARRSPPLEGRGQVGAMGCCKSAPGAYEAVVVVGAPAKEAAAAAGEEVEALRVRKPNGDVVVSLGSRKLRGLSVGSLKRQVGELIGRAHQCEVQLVAAGRPLEDAELLEPLAKPTQVLEIMVLVQELPQLDPDVQPIEQLDILKQMVLCHVFEKQLEGMRHFRKLVSLELDPPIDRVLELAIVPRFIECGRDREHPELQHEALWVLTNIASGTNEHTRAVVEHGAVAAFVEQLSSPEPDVLEQAVWGLGNVAGDSVDFRDAVLEAGVMDPLLALLRSTEKLSALRNEAWCLSNLCRHHPPPEFDAVAPAIPVLAHLLSTAEDDEVLADACWALCYFADAGYGRIQALVDAGTCPRLAELLAHNSSNVVSPALRAVGNIITGDDAQTQAVLDAGVLPRFAALVTHTKREIRKETCWAMSNVLAGTQAQVQQVIDAGLLPAVLTLAESPDHDIRREAHYAIHNLVDSGSGDQVGVLVALGGARPLVAACTGQPALSQQALRTLAAILRAGRALQESGGLPENPYRAEILRSEGVDWLDMVDAEEGDDHLFIRRELIDGSEGAQTEP